MIKFNKEQFIGKYHNEIKLIAGTLNIDFVSCIYNPDNKTVDFYKSNLSNKPVFIQIVDYDDKVIVLNNTLVYILPNMDLSRYLNKLLYTYKIPVEELKSCIYDIDYVLEGDLLDIVSLYFKKLCEKYPSDQELGEEFRAKYGNR